MDYSKHYNLLIDRARFRKLETYTEKHHVVPRCMGGGDEASNIVRLTAEEHYIAHLLLIQMHPGNVKIAFAVLAMRMNSRTKSGSENKHFGWVRRLAAKMRGELRRGKKHSDETKLNWSKSRKGFVHKPETRQAIRVALSGRPKTAEHAAKVSAALMGKPGTRLGMTTSEETKQKQRDAVLRRYYPSGIVPQKAPVDPVRSARAHKAWETKRSRKDQTSAR